jgi:hypothetical protein
MELFGQVIGCHVAPRYLLLFCLSKYIGVRGVRPPDLPHRIVPSQSLSDQWTTVYALLYIWIGIYLNLNYVIVGRGSGRGLAPARSHFVLYMTMPYTI